MLSSILVGFFFFTTHFYGSKEQYEAEMRAKNKLPVRFKFTSPTASGEPGSL